jgi:enamine deaminase RidA (YjgF/YER057c/UK114 family)
MATIVVVRPPSTDVALWIVPSGPPNRRSPALVLAAGGANQKTGWVRHSYAVATGDRDHVGGPLYRGVPYDYGAVAPPGAVLFTAGACPLGADGRVTAPGDHREQARIALVNLLAVLEAHGVGPENLVRTTIYVVGDRDDLVEAWDTVSAGLAPFRPPSTLLGVTVLGYPDQLVEIDGIASLP